MDDLYAGGDSLAGQSAVPSECRLHATQADISCDPEEIGSLFS